MEIGPAMVPYRQCRRRTSSRGDIINNKNK